MAPVNRKCLCAYCHLETATSFVPLSWFSAVLCSCFCCLFFFFAFHSIEVATEFYTRTRDQCQSSVKLLSIERKSNVTLFGQMSNQTSTDNNFTFHQNNCSRRRFSQFLCKSNRNSCRRFFFTLCVCIRVYYDSQQETLTSQSKWTNRNVCFSMCVI